MDGLGTGAAINGGGVSGYGQLETAQEVVMTTAGGLGEAEVGGPVVNLIPKTGGNTFQHHFYGSGMTGWMQSSNYAQALKDFGMTCSPQKTIYLWDISLSSGGPIKKDRLWFFYSTAVPRGAATIFPACTTTRTPATPPSGSTSRTSAVPPRTATLRARSSRRCA